MFDPRDDGRASDGREDCRARVYDERDRDDDPREGLMRDLDLPRSEERELCLGHDLNICRAKDPRRLGRCAQVFPGQIG